MSRLAQPQVQPRQSPMGPHPPPPYRAPPPALYPGGPPSVGTPLSSKPYSKFNVSEPNMLPNRHTFNNENGPQVQSNLRHLLAATPKHSTLDGQGQNAMLQHLRSSGLQDSTNKNGAYVSPDNLRDTANRMFNRNQMDRSSFGGNTNSITAQFQHLNMTDPSKRHSYSNQSFRKAMEQQKIPPQVPPKPSINGNHNNSTLALNDHLDAELKHIMKTSQQRLNMGGDNRVNATPPLPALSPGPGMLMLDGRGGDSSSPDARTKHELTARPDLIGEADKKTRQLLKRSSKDENLHLINGNGVDGSKGRLNMTQGAIDIEKIMANVTGTVTGETSDDNDVDDGEVSTAIDVGDAAAIRRQLDGLENMYGEVLKLLGLKKFGRPAQPYGDNKVGVGSGNLRRHKMYGSMSSLPSVSSIGSRHLYKNQKGLKGYDGQNKRSSSGSRGERSQNKRFQRLESHVVTLARSVAHLSSEVRSQQVILQEVEALRLEVQQLRTHGGHAHPQGQGHGGGQFRNSGFFHNPVSPAHANRVKKLTKFFGDEPPLLRLFLKNLGYEKYATVFEEAKIGMLELPYLSEDRLEKLGIPMGPRMRILQESRASLQNLAPLSLVNTTAATAATSVENPNNYNVYIL